MVEERSGEAAAFAGCFADVARAGVEAGFLVEAATGFYRRE